MKEIIKHSLLSVRRKINQNNIQNCFELFGYDFIMDDDFNLWLIEINTNPCIEESSELLKHYLRRMIEDMVKLVIDPEFPNPKRKKPSDDQAKSRKTKSKSKKKNKKGKSKKVTRKFSFNKNDDLDVNDVLKKDEEVLIESPNKSHDAEDRNIKTSARKNKPLNIMKNSQQDEKLSNSMFLLEHDLYTDLCNEQEEHSFRTY